MQKLGRLGYDQPGNEEGQVKLSLEFFRIPITIQMDIISDWIAELKNLEDQIHMSFAGEFKPKTKEKKNASSSK